MMKMMRLMQALVLLCCVSAAFGATRVILDAFTEKQNLIVELTLPFPTTARSSVTGTMMGGERDSALFGVSGLEGIQVSSQVIGGSWFLACQRTADCKGSLTYDGKDASPNINFSGLGTVDFTNNGANALTLTVQTDIDTFYNLTFYQTGTNGAKFATARFATVTGPPQQYLVPFTSFTTTTGMDFSKVGSYVLFAEGGADVDSTGSLFATFANDISGNVFRDCNVNGVKDSGESAITAVNVTLYDATTRLPIKSAFTDSNGNYIIPTVPGSYFVCAAPAIGIPTNPANNCTGTIDVAIGLDYTGFDFGFTIPVTVTPPADRNVNCSASTAPTSTGTASGTGCSAPTITFSDSETVQCTGRKTIIRTWTATLGADSASGIQTITTFDNTVPIFTSFPTNKALSCGVDSSPATQGTPEATDNCSFASIGFTDIAPTGNGCSAPFQRQWTATDACGNFVSRNQSISINDNAAPVINFFPANATVSCLAGLLPTVDTTPTATDACTEVASITFVDRNTTVGCNLVIFRTWTIKDSCGNAVSRTQQINTLDDTAPTFFQFPQDVSIECKGSITPPFTGGAANATDDCGKVTVTFKDTAPASGCTDPIARTWTAVDNCGNVNTQVQNIFIVDTTPPVFGSNFPADVSGSCTQSSDPSVTGRPTASDACTTVAAADITFSDDVSNDGCTKVIVRTWTIRDTCGNINVRDQRLTYTDGKKPSFTNFPPTKTVNCDEGTTPEFTGAPTGTDDCTLNPSVDFDDSNNGNGCTGGITRTWTVTDACGNTFSQPQTILITDTIKPAFDFFPENTNIECGSDKTPATQGVPTATDNCSSASDIDIEFTDIETGALCPNGVTLTRTWKATDGCGNFVTRNQIIEIDLNQDPIITIPEDTTIDCDDSTAPANTGGFATATSPCGVVVTVRAPVDTVLDGTCPSTISRLWVATDACGNDISATQRIFVNDLERPVLVIPKDITISCADDATDLAKTGRASATDNCDKSIEITFSDSGEATLPQVGTCPADRTFDRTWTAVDDCGNSVSDVQTITVSGTAIGSCRPVECKPVSCDDSVCDNDCPGTPNCLSAPCQAVPCAQGNCAAERCASCPIACKAKPCDKVQYIYVDSIDQIPN
jgi:hypothetical protein